MAARKRFNVFDSDSHVVEPREGWEEYLEPEYRAPGKQALWREDGNIELVGRLSEMFKSGGYNVYPREIELTLEQLPAVAMAAVIGVPDQLYQEVGHAYVLLEPDQSVTEDELRAHCKDHLANYKVPKRFFVRAEFPPRASPFRRRAPAWPGCFS